MSNAGTLTSIVPVVLTLGGVVQGRYRTGMWDLERDVPRPMRGVHVLLTFRKAKRLHRMAFLSAGVFTKELTFGWEFDSPDVDGYLSFSADLGDSGKDAVVFSR